LTYPQEAQGLAVKSSKSLGASLAMSLAMAISKSLMVLWTFSPALELLDVKLILQFEFFAEFQDL
jgi:hypothetical protein